MDRFYQAKAEPVFAAPETVTESRWHQAWSEPLRGVYGQFQAVGLAAAVALSSASGYIGPPPNPIPNPTGTGLGAPFINDTPVPISSAFLYQAKAEPVRFAAPAALPAFPLPPLNEPPRAPPHVAVTSFTFDPKPWPTLDSWYRPLSEPQRLRHQVPEQPQFVADFQRRPPLPTYDWYRPLSEPVRLRYPIQGGEFQVLTTSVVIRFALDPCYAAVAEVRSYATIAETTSYATIAEVNSYAADAGPC